jgi:hypothetical protein
MRSCGKRVSMAKPQKKTVKREPKLDLDPDAWPKFEALVKNAAKMGHKPHQPKVRPKKF